VKTHELHGARPGVCLVEASAFQVAATALIIRGDRTGAPCPDPQRGNRVSAPPDRAEHETGRLAPRQDRSAIHPRQHEPMDRFGLPVSAGFSKILGRRTGGKQSSARQKLRTRRFLIIP